MKLGRPLRATGEGGMVVSRREWPQGNMYARLTVNFGDATAVVYGSKLTL